MKKKIIILALVAVPFFSFLIGACRKDPDTSVDPQLIRFETPEGWPAPFYSFASNKLTRDGFELGRKIFYDPQLSRDRTISCGSCHQAFAGFAQQDHALSHGVGDLLGKRNSPGLANMAWSTSFFWDGGVNNLEMQPINPIQNPVEMDLKIDSVVARLNADPEYRTRFEKVFGDPQVTSYGIFKALAQFMGTMVSANAKYDRFMKGTTTLTASETAGMKVFQDRCADCHKPPLFSDYSFRNNGLSVSSTEDSGRATITRRPEDMHKFRVPSLRNLGFTGPYMHDGRFRTLEQVLDHYDHGVVASATLDPLLQSGIQLTAQQRTDLLSFIKTLNDTSFVNDTRFHESR